MALIDQLIGRELIMKLDSSGKITEMRLFNPKDITPKKEQIEMKTIQAQFLDFARSKPPEEKYDYWDRYQCACAQFAQTLGLGDEYANTMALNDFNSVPLRPFIMLELPASESPWNWGALAERLEAVIAREAANS